METWRSWWLVHSNQKILMLSQTSSFLANMDLLISCWVGERPKSRWLFKNFLVTIFSDNSLRLQGVIAKNVLSSAMALMTGCFSFKKFNCILYIFIKIKPTAEHWIFSNFNLFFTMHDSIMTKHTPMWRGPWINTPKP